MTTEPLTEEEAEAFNQAVDMILVMKWEYEMYRDAYNEYQNWLLTGERNV